jgi:hypothetical protein
MIFLFFFFFFFFLLFSSFSSVCSMGCMHDSRPWQAAVIELASVWIGRALSRIPMSGLEPFSSHESRRSCTYHRIIHQGCSTALSSRRGRWWIRLRASAGPISLKLTSLQLKLAGTSKVARGNLCCGTTWLRPGIQCALSFNMCARPSKSLALAPHLHGRRIKWSRLGPFTDL